MIVCIRRLSMYVVLLVVIVIVRSSSSNEAFGVRATAIEPTKQNALQVLRQFHAAIEKGDYDRAASYWLLRPDWTGGREAWVKAFQDYKNKITTAGIEELAARGELVKMAPYTSKDEPARARELRHLQSRGLTFNEYYRLVIREKDAWGPGAQFRWDGAQLKLFGINQIDGRAKTWRAPTEVAGSSSNESAANTSSQSSLQQEAQKEAEAYWNTKLTRCGDSHFTRKRNEIIQFKGISYKMLTASVSQADRLNGVGFQGVTILTGTAYRYYSGNRWDRWIDGPKEKNELGLYSPSQAISAGIKKENGKWAMEEGYASQVSFYAKISCSAIPPL